MHTISRIMTNLGPNIADMQHRFKTRMDKSMNAATNKTFDAFLNWDPWPNFNNIPDA